MYTALVKAFLNQNLCFVFYISKRFSISFQMSLPVLKFANIHFVCRDPSIYEDVGSSQISNNTYEIVTRQGKIQCLFNTFV